MKTGKVVLVGAILCMGLIFHGERLTGVLDNSSEEAVTDHSFDQLRHCAFQDAAPVNEEQYGYTVPPAYQPLQIHTSDDPDFEYMAYSPYYKVYFKETTMKLRVQDAWITFELPGQGLGEVQNVKSAVDVSLFSVSNVFESVDLSYAVDTSLLTETLILRESKQLDRLIQKISWEGMTPAFEEDGSILFSKEDKKVVKILSPFMKDAEGSVCADVHYELIETETGYELHKVIDEKGLGWLQHAVYPVMIDPSMQTFEDAWESSGLTPYGQYFKNLKEYVNPANGSLTITQTDLVIPGRGLDLVLSRVYQTPAVFYGENPYDYEVPPVNVGKGWQLNFPWIGSKYVHLWGGTVYKIEWSGNTFENHKGSHFILVKNGDNTYTLTTADGMVYEFSTSGNLTEIRDLDQNTITFTYTDGELTSITDTIGRTVMLSYSNNRLWKILYNSAEIEYSYDADGCLQWMEDFLNRRTSYSYNTGYNDWLLSKIEYPTTGYTTYAYSRFQDGNYYKYYVTHQRVYETTQVRHSAFTYTGSFSEITSCTTTVKNESDVTQGFYSFTIIDGLITQRTIKNASGTPLRKYIYTYNTHNEITETRVYYDGSTLSYTHDYSYDNWGNLIYVKNAEGHEQFFSYANTDTSGFFVDNTGTVIQKFTNAFSNCSVPSSVHTVLLGAAEGQDDTYVREMYATYDLEAHPTQSKNVFGNATTWLTFSGTFNEKTGSTSFPIDLTGHTVTGNGVLEITGLPSDDAYQESHFKNCGCPLNCAWLQGHWSNNYFSAKWWRCIGFPPDCDDGWVSVGPFTHYPGTLGYQSYTTNPPLGEGGYYSSITVTTNWRAYPVQVQYKLDSGNWTTVTSNLKNTTAKKTVPITDGLHTLYFSESSSEKTKFSWYLYVPVDNSPNTYTTTMTYDTYGNVTSVTDGESNTVTLTYSSDYSYAYVTEISATVDQDTITTKAAYDYYRGWITSIQQPKGVASSGYDTLYTYDLLGRIIKKEFPLLPGQSERSYTEAVYDCENRTVTLVDPLGHYIVKEHDKLGRLTSVKAYTGQFGTGTLYATTSYTYNYNDKVLTVRDPGNHTTTYTYDFLGRITQVLSPDSSTITYSYDDTSNKITFTDGRGYNRILWFDWLSRLTKVEEEYEINSFAVTTYQYDEGNHLISFTDAESRTTSYTYGSLFGLTRITYPDSTHEEYVYDSAGNITSYTDAKGNETQFLYDTLYRLTQIQYQDQSTISFTYDLNSNRTRMDDHSPNQGGYVEYKYDHWNRLITETRHISANTYAVSYQYDSAHRLTKLTYPDSTQILYSYDDLNRMTEIKRYIDGVNDEVLIDNVQYNSESLLTQFDYGNDLRATFSYDPRDRLSTIDIKDGETPFLDFDYTYDNNSNITQLINGWRDTSSNWHSQTESYSYDGLDRLTSASTTSWSHTYSYDKVGNRTAKDGVTYTINVVDEVTALSDGTTFTYDTNGNRTGKTKGSDTWVYTYDYANRLTRVEKNSVTLGEYVYDGGGRRIQVTENGATTTYVYSGINVLYEENSTGTAAYIYGPTGRLAKRTTIDNESHTFYYHTDHLGSTRLVTDESKTIVTDVNFEPFGESTMNGEESYLFTGKEKDSTGLYYYGARYYDPDLGRFITKDPLRGKKALPQSLNRYTYCLNNPIKFVDPAGLTTGRMCDTKTGTCVRFFETGSHGWVAYDAHGNVITSQEEIQSLLDERKYLEAVVLLLQVFGHDVDMSDITYYVTEEDLATWVSNPNPRRKTLHIGHIQFTVDGREVTVYVDLHKFLPRFSSGHTYLMEDNSLEMYLDLSPYIEANRLFHIVGHECVHVDQHVSGRYAKWLAKHGPEGAEARAEIDAYLHNFIWDFFGITFKGSSVEHLNSLRKWIERFNECCT